MNITEVRIKLVNDASDKLLAFGSITINNEFVIRDLKIVRGSKGEFVAMPSRKLTDRCPKCKGKNHLRATFCNDCGARLKPDRAPKDPQGRKKLHADIAHPINSCCREELQKEVLSAYKTEKSNGSNSSRGSSGSSDYDDYDDFDDYDETDNRGEDEKKDFDNGIFT